MLIATLILGFLGLLLWGYVACCFFYKRILVDRILSRGQSKNMLIVIILIAVLPFSMAFVAWLNDIQPYDLLYNTNIYGQGSDLEAKLMYRQGIIDKISEQSEDPSLVSTVFFHFRGLGNEFAAGTPKGRMWAFYIGLIGILVLGGVLIPCVLRVVNQRAEDYTWGRQRYNIQKSPFAVIFGANEMVPDLIKKILSDTHKQKIKYVIVHTSDNVFNYRRDIENRLTSHEQRHLILYNGMRTNPGEIKKLHLERAKEVYVLGENASNESEADHDSMNMECVRLIAQNLKDMERKDRLQCYAMFENHTTFNAFLYSDLSKIVKDQIEFIYMNYYEMWAQNVFTRPQPTNKNKVRYLPLEGDVCLDKNSEQYVHLVIVGMNNMGIAMAIEAAHTAHYPNFISKNKRTKITFIDAHADKEMAFLKCRYPDYCDLCRWRLLDMSKEDALQTPWNDKLNQMAEMKRAGKDLPFEKYPYSHLADPKAADANFIDIEWEFMKGTIETRPVKKYLEKCSVNKDELLTVVICQENTSKSIAIGLYLPREIYRNAVQVLVYQKQSADIINDLSGLGHDQESLVNVRYNKLRPFGMLSESFSNHIVDNRLAKLVNYIYNYKQDTTLECVNEIDPGESLPRQEVCWRDCHVADQWSSSYNANSILTKLRFLGFDFRKSTLTDMKKVLRADDTMDILAEVEHNRWNTEKLMMGYRPLNNEEIVEFMEMLKNGVSIEDYYLRKNALKNGWDKAHLDICSFEQLKTYDKPSIEYDVVLNKAFPAIVEWMRASMS